MALICELDEAVGEIARLLQEDTDAETDLMGWADERWRVRQVLTDDLITVQEYPVIYVSASGQQRKLLWHDTFYEVRMDVDVIIEQQWAEPDDLTNTKRQLTLLCRRVEEVLRRARINEPFWDQSCFTSDREPLKLDLYQLKMAQHLLVGGMLGWFGFRQIQLA